MNVYISGPLTGTSDAPNLKTFYEQLGRVCSRAGSNPIIPHLVSDPVVHADLSPQSVYALDRSGVVSSDLVIAYVGLPAIGVGQEVEIACQHDVPVCLVYEKGRVVTRMVRGNPAVVCEIVETNREDILAQLEKRIGDLSNQR